VGNTLENKISQYKRKFYLNQVIKGVLISATILLSVFLFFVLLEYQANFDKTARSILFYIYLGLAAFVFYKLIIDKLLKLFIAKRQLSDFNAAKNIGGFFPDVQDKLLNIVQLKSLQSQNQLALASVNQKTQQIIHVDFSDAVDFRNNVRYLKILIIPFLVVILLGIFSPSVLTEPAKRIAQHKKDFVLKAPFEFELLNKNLLAFKNEDFDLQVQLTGESVPSDLFLLLGDRRIKLTKSEDNTYHFNIEKVQQNFDFQFTAAGFNSSSYEINVVNRPNIKNFEAELIFPKYLNRKVERLNNIGNFQIPEGTNIKWYYQTLNTNDFEIYFENADDTIDVLNTDNQLFTYEKQFFNSTNYTLSLSNEYSKNKDLIQYNIDVIKDKYPKIDVQLHKDTVLYNLIVFGGQISDDYGLTRLRLNYRVSESNEKDADFKAIPIAIDRSKNQQSFYMQWLLDSMKLKSGDKLEYYLAVSDNDGINGAKTTRTGVYQFKIPDKQEVIENLSKASESAENQIDKSIEDAKQLKKELEKAEDRLKGKKELSWQDEQLMQDIVEQKQELEEEIKKLQEKYKDFSEMKNRFSEDEEKNKRISEKVEQLQQLMDELLDEETKKLYEELQELLEEKKNVNDIKDIVEKLNQKEFNLEKELERSLELFKKLKYEQKLDEAIDKSDELSQEQQELMNETEEKESDSDDLSEKQSELKEELDQLEENIDELNEINKDLKNPNPPADFKEDLENIKNSMNESQENLQENKKKKANKAQQNAQQQLKKMSEKLQQMQGATEMMSMQSNLGDLREILENLIKLSFEQESNMDQFRNVNQSDPKFLELSQEQLNIQDDAKIIEDSLYSLANRVFQIQSFVTREVGEMNKNINEAVEAIKERKKDIAVGKQQYAMTSMNNLALMIDDVMTQMQQAMADMMGNSKGDQNQMGQAPSITELQQQLNQQIQQLKQSGKQGRQLSEELAKMAAEQEKIRQMLEKMQNELNNNPLQEGEKAGDNLSDAIKKMEETEMDLVNKNITERTIRRQQEIVTRLLEAEKSMRERELSEEREGEQAKKFKREIPKEFEDYIKNKEQEIELLKTVPPKLNPYYKEEVNKYFNRLGNF